MCDGFSVASMSAPADDEPEAFDSLPSFVQIESNAATGLVDLVSAGREDEAAQHLAILVPRLQHPGPASGTFIVAISV